MKRFSPFLRTLLAISAIGAALRLMIALRPLTILDRFFLPDDTYYTLEIARSLAAGVGPSASADVLTNGFQPLFAFLIVPAFAIFDVSADGGVTWAIALGALFGALNVPLLGLLGRSAGGDVCGWVAAALWAVSPIAISGAFTGLETSLSLSLALAAVLLWESALRGGTYLSYALAGVCVGFALLSRVDLAFLIVLLGFISLTRRHWTQVTVAAGCALLVVAPWWLYSTMTFGSPVPESGAAVRALVVDHQSVHMTPQLQVSYAACKLAGSPIISSSSLCGQLAGGPLGWLLFGIIAAFLALGTLWAWRAGAKAAAAFQVQGLILMGFYGFYIAAIWFYPRYFHSVSAGLSLCFGLFCAWLLRYLEARSASLVGLKMGIGGAVALGAFGTLPYLTVVPEGSIDYGLHGAKGYREAAQQILSQLPETATLGALQSGALNYYAPPGVRVVNLDGVVDGGAAAAIQNRTLTDYVYARGITHIADWPFNIEAIGRFSREAERHPSLRHIAQAGPQGLDAYQLFSINWENGSE